LPILTRAWDFSSACPGSPITRPFRGGGQIVFKDCDALTLLLAAGTDYLNRREQGWKGEPPHRRLISQLAAASEKSFQTLLNEHVRDYQSLFGRLKLSLGPTAEPTRGPPTDERLAAGLGS
jgi:alpha-L-fucosidase 2